MTPEAYAKTVRKRMKWPFGADRSDRMMKVALGLVAEAGEFAGELEKSWGRGKALDGTVRDHLRLELGDVVFFLVAACAELDVDLEEIFDANDAKLTAREAESAPAQLAHEVIAVCPGCALWTLGKRGASGHVEIIQRSLHFVRVGTAPNGGAIAVFDRYNRGGAHEIVEFSRKT